MSVLKFSRKTAPRSLVADSFQIISNRQWHEMRSSSRLTQHNSFVFLSIKTQLISNSPFLYNIMSKILLYNVMSTLVCSGTSRVFKLTSQHILNVRDLKGHRENVFIISNPEIRSRSPMYEKFSGCFFGASVQTVCEKSPGFWRWTFLYIYDRITTKRVYCISTATQTYSDDKLLWWLWQMVPRA